MDIVYTLIVMFTSTEGSLDATTTISITGYDSMEACVLALDNANEAVGNDPAVIDYEAACVLETSA